MGAAAATLRSMYLNFVCNNKAGCELRTVLCGWWFWLTQHKPQAQDYHSRIFVAFFNTHISLHQLTGRSKVTPISGDTVPATDGAGHNEVTELKERVAELEREREVYKKELALIYALDNIRDEYTDPAAMFEAIVALVVNEFSADVCLLYLFDRESGELELWGDHPVERPDIARRIRDPSPLFEFIDNPKNQANLGTYWALLTCCLLMVSRLEGTESSDGVKINILGVLPPHLLKEPTNKSNKPTLTPIPQARRNSSRGPHIKMNVAAMSIIMHEKRMGLLVIARHAPFSPVGITAFVGSSFWFDFIYTYDYSKQRSLK